MLTIKQITDDKEGVIKGLEKKHFAGAREAIDAVLRQNDLRRETQGKLDTPGYECKIQRDWCVDA